MAVYFGNKIFMYNPIGDVRCSSYSVKGVHAWKPLQSVEHGKDFNLELDLITDYPMAKWIAVPVLIFEEIKPDWSLYMKETWGVEKKPSYGELMEDHMRRMKVFKQPDFIVIDDPHPEAIKKRYETVDDVRVKEYDCDWWLNRPQPYRSGLTGQAKPALSWNHDRTKPIGKLVKNCGSNTYRIVSYPLTTLQITKTLAPGDKMEISVYGKTYDITSAASYGATEIKIYEGKEEGICVVANTGYAALHYPEKQLINFGGRGHSKMQIRADYFEQLWKKQWDDFWHLKEPQELCFKGIYPKLTSADICAPLQSVKINGMSLCTLVTSSRVSHYKNNHKALSFRYYNPMSEKSDIIHKNSDNDGYKQHYDTMFASMGDGMIQKKSWLLDAREKGKITYKCLLCGRSGFGEKQPHACNVGTWGYPRLWSEQLSDCEKYMVPVMPEISHYPSWNEVSAQWTLNRLCAAFNIKPEDMITVPEGFPDVWVNRKRILEGMKPLTKLELQQPLYDPSLIDETINEIRKKNGWDKVQAPKFPDDRITKTNSTAKVLVVIVSILAIALLFVWGCMELAQHYNRYHTQP